MEGELLILENTETGEALKIRETIAGGQARIAPEGRLTMETVHDLEDELTSMALICSDVTIDLEGVQYIANSVLRMILEIQHMVDSRDGSLKIEGVNESLWGRFEELGLEDVFEIHRSSPAMQ